MSVVVIDGNMPINYDSCWYLDCKCWKECSINGKPDNCPLRTLPEKHGRLIDGTSLLDQVLEIRDEEAERNGTESIGFILTTMMAAMVTVQDTIVEAEGE